MKTFAQKLAKLENRHDEKFNKVGYYRCYDGCPDSALQLKYEIEDLILKEIRKIYPSAKATYFPAEGAWQVHKGSDHKYENIGKFMPNKKAALLSAVEELDNPENMA